MDGNDVITNDFLWASFMKIILYLDLIYYP